MGDKLSDMVFIFAGSAVATILLVSGAGALKQRYSALKDWTALEAEYDQYDDSNLAGYYFGEDSNYEAL